MRYLHDYLNDRKSSSWTEPTFNLKLAESLYQGSLKVFPWLMAGAGCVAGMAAAAFGAYMFGLGLPAAATIGLSSFLGAAGGSCALIGAVGMRDTFAGRCLAILAGIFCPITLGGVLGFYMGAGIGYLMGYGIGGALAALAYAGDFVTQGFAAAMQLTYAGACFVASKVSDLLESAAKIFSGRKATPVVERHEENSKASTATTNLNTPSQSVIRSHLKIDIVHSQSSEDAATEITPTPPPSPSEYINFYKEAQGVKDNNSNDSQFMRKINQLSVK